MDTGIKYIFVKSANDTKPFDAISMLEGRDAVQGDFDRLKR